MLARMATTLKAHMRAMMTDAIDKYRDDLEAMPEDLLAKSPGGTARRPLDFTYEIVVINRRIACRLRNEDPGKFAFEGWVTAPVEFAAKEVVLREFNDTCQAVLDAYDAVPEDEIERVIPLPQGQTSPLDLATLMASHTMYHDAQLNYAQCLAGDDQMHWKYD